MKVKLFERTSQSMSYIIVNPVLNKQQLKDLNLLKISCIQVKSSKGHYLTFLLMGKCSKVNMPSVNKFCLKPILNSLYSLCHSHVVEVSFLLQ